MCYDEYRVASGESLAPPRHDCGMHWVGIVGGPGEHDGCEQGTAQVYYELVVGCERGTAQVNLLDLVFYSEKRMCSVFPFIHCFMPSF